MFNINVCREISGNVEQAYNKEKGKKLNTITLVYLNCVHGQLTEICCYT